MSSSLISSISTGGIFIPNPRETSNVLESIIERDQQIMTDYVKTVQQFKNKFQQLVEKKVGKNGKIILFIDDLDRVSPDKVVQILEAIKIFLETKNCVFVIGCDLNYLNYCIKMRYKNLPYSGFEYIEKIIQLPFNVPSLSESDTYSLIKTICPEVIVLENLQDYLALMDRSIGRNPRNMKRVLNLFNIVKTFAVEKDDYDDLIILKLLCFQLKWPEIFSNFMRSYFINPNENYFKMFELLARPLRIQTFGEYFGYDPPGEYYEDLYDEVYERLEQEEYAQYKYKLEEKIKLKEDFQKKADEISRRGFSIPEEILLSNFLKVKPHLDEVNLDKYFVLLENIGSIQTLRDSEISLENVISFNQFNKLLFDVQKLFNGQNVPGFFFRKKNKITLAKYIDKRSGWYTHLDKWKILGINEKTKENYEEILIKQKRVE